MYVVVPLLSWYTQWIWDTKLAFIICCLNTKCCSVRGIETTVALLAPISRSKTWTAQLRMCAISILQSTAENNGECGRRYHRDKFSSKIGILHLNKTFLPQDSFTGRNKQGRFNLTWCAYIFSTFYCMQTQPPTKYIYMHTLYICVTVADISKSQPTKPTLATSAALYLLVHADHSDMENGTCNKRDSRSTR